MIAPASLRQHTEFRIASPLCITSLLSAYTAYKCNKLSNEQKKKKKLIDQNVLTNTSPSHVLFFLCAQGGTSATEIKVFESSNSRARKLHLQLPCLIRGSDWCILGSLRSRWCNLLLKSVKVLTKKEKAFESCFLKLWTNPWMIDSYWRTYARAAPRRGGADVSVNRRVSSIWRQTPNSTKPVLMLLLCTAGP